MNTKSRNKRIHIFSALEVANMCGVVNQTAINWIKNGYLKAFNTPGGQYRVYKDDLKAFIIQRGMRMPDDLAELPETDADWKTVIVIDDDLALNNAIAGFVQKNIPGISVIQSFDGFDAGAKLVEKKPGFVILDLALPGVVGQEICSRIKNDPAFGKPYIMVITALEDPELEKQLYDLGADRFFRKPLVMQDMVSSIVKAMETV